MTSKIKNGDATMPDDGYWISEDLGLGVLEDLIEGRTPSDKELAGLLRNSSYRVHQRVREYLADRLEGKIEPRKGRPPSPFNQILARQFAVRIMYHLILWDVRGRHKSQRHGHGTPSEKAFEETSRRLATDRNIHISPGEVRRIVYPPKQAPRRRNRSN